MTANPEITSQRNIPSRLESITFRGKTALLQLKRGVTDQTSRSAVRHPKRSELSEAGVIAVSRTPLWTETAPDERFLVAGKIHNLRLATRRLNGVEIPGGQIFSFW